MIHIVDKHFQISALSVLSRISCYGKDVIYVTYRPIARQRLGKHITA
jgi:hypothetical protein